MANAQEEFGVGRLRCALDQVLKISISRLTGIYNKVLGLCGLGVDIGNEMLHDQKQNCPKDEYFEVWPDKYRALHSPRFGQSPWSTLTAMWITDPPLSNDPSASLRRNFTDNLTFDDVASELTPLDATVQKVYWCEESQQALDGGKTTRYDAMRLQRITQPM